MKSTGAFSFIWTVDTEKCKKLYKYSCQNARIKSTSRPSIETKIEGNRIDSVLIKGETGIIKKRMMTKAKKKVGL